MAEKLYYIENPRESSHVSWWAKSDQGYTENIDLAKVFTEAEVAEKYSIYKGKKFARLKSEVDKRVRRTLATWELDNIKKWQPEK